MPVLEDQATSTVTYYGVAPLGSLSSDPVWEILKLDTATGSLLTSVIDSKDRKGAIWDNRTTYTYG